MPDNTMAQPAQESGPVCDVAVLGGGSFGTAMTKVLADNGHRVHFWMRDADQVREIDQTRINSRYMPGVRLEGRIEPTTDLAGAVSRAEVVFVAIPSKAFRSVIREHSGDFRDGQIVISLTKGIRSGRLQTDE